MYATNDLETFSLKIKGLISSQKEYFKTNATKPIKVRKGYLVKLKKLLQKHESELYSAIYKDFKKSKYETYITELALIYQEIDFALKNIRKWSQLKKVRDSIGSFPSKNYIITEPLGSVLIIGAWNYPYYLALTPVISALAAGNTVILKPSEVTLNVSKTIAKIINSEFDSKVFRIVEGGVNETTKVLEYKFDKIFFTGSASVGRIIYKAAAKHLTPVVLELGGKSPTFVFSDTDIKKSVQRIVWAKFLNAGQTCIAPDYLVVEKQIYDDFIKSLQEEINKCFPKKDVTENYVQIINMKNVNRLSQYLDYNKSFIKKDKRYIEPIVLENASFSDKVMEEEIFGPILPIIVFDDLDNVIRKIKDMPRPLACYIFTKNSKIKNKIMFELSFGNGAVNDCLTQVANLNLPFGGIGESGIGAYHGEYGFKAFSHQKSITEKKLFFDNPLKYTPYSWWKFKLSKLIFG